MLLTDFDASRQAVINPDMLFFACAGFAGDGRQLLFARHVRADAGYGGGCARACRTWRREREIPHLPRFVAGDTADVCAGDGRRAVLRGDAGRAARAGCEAVRRIRQLRRAESADSRLRHHHPDRRRARRRHELPLRAAVGRNSGESEIPRAGFEAILRETGVDFTEGKVWTTDAFYRETRAKVALRKAQGCVCVDMECSALMALAQFRGIDVFEFFYAGDNLDREQWNPRSLSTHAKLDEKRPCGVSGAGIGAENHPLK